MVTEYRIVWVLVNHSNNDRIIDYWNDRRTAIASAKLASTARMQNIRARKLLVQLTQVCHLPMIPNRYTNSNI